MLEDRMAYFIDLVERNEPGEIEMARDVVTREDVGPLVEAYWTLATWDEKAALVNGRAFALFVSPVAVAEAALGSTPSKPCRRGPMTTISGTSCRGALNSSAPGRRCLRGRAHR